MRRTAVVDYWGNQHTLTSMRADIRRARAALSLLESLVTSGASAQEVADACNEVDGECAAATQAAYALATGGESR